MLTPQPGAIRDAIVAAGVALVGAAIFFTTLPDAWDAVLSPELSSGWNVPALLWGGGMMLAGTVASLWLRRERRRRREDLGDDP